MLTCMLACSPDLAPASGLDPADLHRPEPAPPRQPRRPGPPLCGFPGQGFTPASPGRAADHSFRGLLEHLAALTRNQVRYTGTHVTIPMFAEPTSTERQAFELLGAPIPLTLK
jgi:hypothetical protein